MQGREGTELSPWPWQILNVWELTMNLRPKETRGRSCSVPIRLLPWVSAKPLAPVAPGWRQRERWEIQLASF